MERFWCCLAGFGIALALVAGFLIVKSVVEERKEKNWGTSRSRSRKEESRDTD